VIPDVKWGCGKILNDPGKQSFQRPAGLPLVQAYVMITKVVDLSLRLRTAAMVVPRLQADEVGEQEDMLHDFDNSSICRPCLP